MVTIYCSRRLELFLRRPLAYAKCSGEARPEVAAERNDPEPVLGNWNAYTFRLSAKQCVIFVNSKTCYCVAAIFERQMPDINLWFEEILVRQLNDDFKLSETVEASGPASPSSMMPPAALVMTIFTFVTIKSSMAFTTMASPTTPVIYLGSLPPLIDSPIRPKFIGSNQW